MTLWFTSKFSNKFRFFSLLFQLLECPPVGFCFFNYHLHFGLIVHRDVLFLWCLLWVGSFWTLWLVLVIFSFLWLAFSLFWLIVWVFSGIWMVTSVLRVSIFRLVAVVAVVVVSFSGFRVFYFFIQRCCSWVSLS